MSIKDSILLILNQNIKNSVSGSEIANTLSISRNSVWKSISSLKQQGYPIEASTNRGYRLMKAEDIISSALISKELQTEEIGRTISVFESLSSTNDYAKAQAAKGVPKGTVIIANNQTSGKGRKGRGFYSPENSGIYMSIILRPGFSTELGSTVTCLAAVAAAEAIEAVSDLDIGIKWVNDLYCKGKKLCGILTEAVMDFESGGLEYMVVGIGINVAKMDFPPEISEIATSISNLCSKDISRNKLISELLNRFEARFTNIESRGFIEEYRKRSIVTGREVTVTCGNQSYTARVTGIDDWGHLIIQTDEGEKLLNSGEVSIKM